MDTSFWVEDSSTAVEGGTGIALISRQAAHEEIVNKKLVAVPLRASTISRKFYMITHKNKYISGSVQDLIDLIFRWAAEFVQNFPN